MPSDKLFFDYDSTPLGQAVACLYKYGETKVVYIVVTEGEFKDNTTFVDPVKGMN